MVLPSENERFVIVCIEAFAMYVPVIRTKTGEYSDMKNYYIGVNYGDTCALGKAIFDEFNDENKTIKMTNSAFNFYKEN